jgi:hypothetical protein
MLTIKQAFFEAHPQFAARFPGGIIQFAQIAANLPEDALEDMMIAEADNVQQPNRELPGQMPGHPVFDFEDAPLLEEQEGGEVEGDEGEGYSDDDEDEEGEEVVAVSVRSSTFSHLTLMTDLQPLPVRLLRNMVNRFFGSAQPAPESDSDEEVVAPRDQDGVD